MSQNIKITVYLKWSFKILSLPTIIFFCIKWLQSLETLKYKNFRFTKVIQKSFRKLVKHILEEISKVINKISIIFISDMFLAEKQYGRYCRTTTNERLSNVKLSKYFLFLRAVFLINGKIDKYFGIEKCLFVV